jgi:hypothetical protein
MCVSRVNNTPYLFTGKEFDQETGLYYFGARYYDPRTSVWQSADPILEKYLPDTPKKPDDIVKLQPPTMQQSLAQFNLPGMGGVFNTTNMAMYTYAGQNPSKYIDPDGNANLVGSVGGSFVPGFGAEGSVGIYMTLPTDGYNLDIGVFASGGFAVGYNVGLSAQAGGIEGGINDIKGITGNLNGGGTVVGGTALFNTKGDLVGGTAGPSVEVGASVSVAKTGAVSLTGDLGKNLNDLGSQLGGWLFDNFGPSSSP